MSLAKFSALLMVVVHVGIAACTTTPVGNRARIIDIPLADVQANVEFTIVSASRSYLSCAEKLACLSDAGEDESKSFDQEIVRIAGALQTAALKLYPDLAWCTAKPTGGCFDVYVVEGDEPGSSSSANGRIALNAALDQWQDYDGVLALVIGREMGHVIARHHQERSSVSMVASVLLNIFIPGSGVLKSLICTGGARFAAASTRKLQALEADVIAFRLLKGAGFRLRDVAGDLLVAPAMGDENAWARGFDSSANTLISEANAAETTVASTSSDQSSVRPGQSGKSARATAQ